MPCLFVFLSNSFLHLLMSFRLHFFLSYFISCYFSFICSFLHSSSVSHIHSLWPLFRINSSSQRKISNNILLRHLFHCFSNSSCRLCFFCFICNTFPPDWQREQKSRRARNVYCNVSRLAEMN